MLFIAKPSHWKSVTSAITKDCIENTVINLENKTWKAIMMEAAPILNKKPACLFINDMTEITHSRSGKENQEMRGGLTTLFSDLTYEYQNMVRMQRGIASISTRAKGVSCITNMTFQTHIQMIRQFVNSTFFDRFFRIRYDISDSEYMIWEKDREARLRYEYRGKKVTFKPFAVKTSDFITKELMHIRDNTLLYDDRVDRYVVKSDMSPHRYLVYLDAIVKCHAHLQGRVEVTSDDIDYIRNDVLPLSVDALSAEAKAYAKHQDC